MGPHPPREVVRRGFVLFVPHRRGHGKSSDAGPYTGRADDPETVVGALVTQTDDVMSAIAYVAASPDVTPDQVVVSGCSYGGIETLFAAERGTGIAAAIDFSSAQTSRDTDEVEGIPAEAIYDPEDEQCELGKRDRKGRISLERELLFTLDPKKYAAKNFGKLPAPPELLKLVDFQNDVGAETFAQGFMLDAFMPIAAATGTGSWDFVWNRGKREKPAAMPVVLCGDEGCLHLVAASVAELLQIVGADVEPMVSWDEVTYFKAKRRRAERRDKRLSKVVE